MRCSRAVHAVCAYYGERPLRPLQDGLTAGRLERWRGGVAIDRRPLSALRSATLEGAASQDIRLQLQDEVSRQSCSCTHSSDSAYHPC